MIRPLVLVLALLAAGPAWSQTAPLADGAAPAAAAPSEAPPPAAAPRPRVIPLDLGTPAAKPPPRRLGDGRLVVPVPLEPPRAAAAEGDALKLPLNKTRPIDLPVDVRDVVVGNPEIADVLVRSERQVFLMAKAVGDTNLFFLDRNGQVIRRMEVNVHLDIDTLSATLRELVPQARVEARAVGDTVYLSGTAPSAALAADIRTIARRFVTADANVVSLVRVGGSQQVLIRVRVAEMQRRAVKGLGLNATFNDNGGGDSLTLGWGAGTLITRLSTNLSATIQALEEDSVARTLAEPSLTAVSGEQASLLAGGEVPIISAPNAQGSREFDYRPFGVLLTFLPVVVDGGRISLQIQTQASTVVFTEADSPPTFAVRRASSTVELPSGGSIMIAGLLQNDLNSLVSGLPLLKDLPILGALFRSSEFERNETELVVAISAYLVEPVDGGAIALPTDGFIPAGDLDRYLLGRLHKVYDREDLFRAFEPGMLKAPIGYVVH